MIPLLYTFTIAYLLLVFLLVLTWVAIPYFFRSTDAQPLTKVTVIIPVRNEEKNILRLLADLKDQHYPAELMEVIVVNDHSTDGTEKVVQAYSRKLPFILKLLHVPEEFRNSANKKRAIELGIRAASGDLILTTDGDCHAGPDWIGVMEEFYRVHSCKMICGPVYIDTRKSLSVFASLQGIEFASLIGSGAVTLAWGTPTMCNGANLAYEKKVFEEVGGYDGNRELASGDDEFLMHKIHALYPGSVKFIKAEEAIITTDAQSTIRSFIHQRIRWASKWNAYKNYAPKILAVMIFAFNLCLIAGAFLAVTGKIPGILFLEQFLVKILAEFVFLRSILAFSGRRINLIHFFLLQFIYPFYVVFMALAGLKGNYQWKERKIIRA